MGYNTIAVGTLLFVSRKGLGDCDGEAGAKHPRQFFKQRPQGQGGPDDLPDERRKALRPNQEFRQVLSGPGNQQSGATHLQARDLDGGHAEAGTLLWRRSPGWRSGGVRAIHAGSAGAYRIRRRHNQRLFAAPYGSGPSWLAWSGRRGGPPASRGPLRRKSPWRNWPSWPPARGPRSPGACCNRGKRRRPPR